MYDGTILTRSEQQELNEFEKRQQVVSDENALISKFVGLNIRYELCGNPIEGQDWDMEIDAPDFLDHDEDLLYLYETDKPEENFKFHADWNWLMGAIEKIASQKFEDGDTAHLRTFGARGEDGRWMVRFNRHALFQSDTLIEAAFCAVVDFIKSLGTAYKN